jgi:hypothetical protein
MWEELHRVQRCSINKGWISSYWLGYMYQGMEPIWDQFECDECVHDEIDPKGMNWNKYRWIQLSIDSKWTTKKWKRFWYEIYEIRMEESIGMDVLDFIKRFRSWRAAICLYHTRCLFCEICFHWTWCEENDRHIIYSHTYVIVFNLYIPFRFLLFEILIMECHKLTSSIRSVSHRLVVTLY